MDGALGRKSASNKKVLECDLQLPVPPNQSHMMYFERKLPSHLPATWFYFSPLEPWFLAGGTTNVGYRMTLT